MKYNEFKAEVRGYPIFRSSMFTHITKDVATLRRQMSEWVVKGYVLSLKRGLYTLTDDDRQVGLSRYLLANELYKPSYISLETALSYYGIIPEAVHVVTSISSKKTQRFQNALGMYTYHHCKPECYGGFVEQKDEYGAIFLIATKEKAIIDFLYFRCRDVKSFDQSIFEEAFRFQNLDDVNPSLLVKYSDDYGYKKLKTLVKLLINDMEEKR